VHVLETGLFFLQRLHSKMAKQETEHLEYMPQSTSKEQQITIFYFVNRNILNCFELIIDLCIPRIKDFFLHFCCLV